MSTRTLSAAPPVAASTPESDQLQALATRLIALTPIAPAEIRFVRAPLRICPLGAHIDHQLGVVTGMTIDHSILMAFAPTDDGLVHVESRNFDDSTQFALRSVPGSSHGDWGNYLRGAVLALQQECRLDRGVVGVVGGDMPIGGLSSSAAVTIAYLLALQAVNGIRLSAAENVALSRYTENVYIGLNNGILDQSVILYSEEQHLTRIDCQSVVVDQIASRAEAAMPPFEILSVYSGLTNVLVGTDYNDRVAECQEAARLLIGYAGGEAPSDPRLRHADAALFASESQRLPDRPRKRARHYFGEMQRVADGVEAWRAGDLTRFGALVTASGESSIVNYECGSPQLITLYEILAQTPGVYGTRFSGAGFRGNCIALIDPARRDEIAEAVHRRYPIAHPEEAERYSIHFCRPDGHACLLDRSASQSGL